MERRHVRSYRDLEIWQLARELAVIVHKIGLGSSPLLTKVSKEYSSQAARRLMY